MSIGGEALVTGPYTCTWNAVALGVFQGDNDVPTIAKQLRGRKIESSDYWGMTPMDEIHLGAAYFFYGVLMEYSKALPIIEPFTTTLGLEIGVIGVLKRSLSKALVLTAVAGTTAATAPASLTASKTILATDHETRLAFGPVLRTVPIKLDLFPYQTATGPNKYGFFTMT